MTELLSEGMRELGRQARRAARALARADTRAKDRALAATAEAIARRRDEILEANQADLAAARGADLSSALVDRLTVGPKGLEAVIAGLSAIRALPDPVGAIEAWTPQANGLRVGRMRVPLGVIGVIYESRPNVTIDAAALCLKAGNAVILRGGSEAFRSNQVLARCAREGLAEAGLPQAAVQALETTDRGAVGELLRMDDYIDVLIPRGGKGLIERVSRDATIPVIKHLDGVCHVYVDDRADPAMAEAIVVNAKTQRYGTCNTMETLLVARAIAERVLPAIGTSLLERGVELRGCAQTCALVPGAIPASEADWGTEYLAPVLAVRVVDHLDAAMDHIARYGSAHTDAIVTNDLERAERFLREVDSSSVMVNASTRFADGFEYGLGAEIGISTNKLHARGPVGLAGLTTEKWVVMGRGHVRQ